MGTKPAFKRYKNPVYFTCCILGILFLYACQQFTPLRVISTSVDTNEKRYLATTREFLLKKDFKSAARENKRVLEYYRRIPDMNDIILSNYVQNAKMISILLAQIAEDEKNNQTLYRKIKLCEDQVKAFTQTNVALEKKADTLNDKIKTLENEKKLLEKQIEQLKEIDLNSNKVTGNLGSTSQKTSG